MHMSDQHCSCLLSKIRYQMLCNEDVMRSFAESLAWQLLVIMFLAFPHPGHSLIGNQYETDPGYNAGNTDFSASSRPCTSAGVL